MAVAESEYRDAQEAWLKNDPNLEQDLYKRNREEIRGRIRRAAALRDDVMVKKEVYLGLLVKRFDDLGHRLSGLGDAKIPAEQLKKDLEQEQSRLLNEQERLEALIRDLPPGDEYSLVRRAMEAERTDLVGLQNSVALRIRSLDKMGATQQAAADLSRGDGLEQKIGELKQIWEDERARAVRARATWAHYYQALSQSLDAKPAPASVEPANDRPRALAPLPPPASAQTPSATASVVLMGSWVYRSQPGAWVGYGEPESVTLQIQRTGDRIEGRYVARLPGRGETRILDLLLQGTLLSDREARVQWTSQRPAAHGEMSLKLGADGRLLVQRLNSDDSYIPRGMEVLLRQ